MATVVQEIILQEANLTVIDVHAGTLVGSITQAETSLHKADIRVDKVHTGTLIDPVRNIETSPHKAEIMVTEGPMGAMVRLLHSAIPKEAGMTLEEFRTARKTALVRKILQTKAKVMGKVPVVAGNTWNLYSQQSELSHLTTAKRSKSNCFKKPLSQ